MSVPHLLISVNEEIFDNTIFHQIKEKFGHDYVKQDIFKQSFEFFLKYKGNKGFVIDFDDIYEWVGFTRKDNAKRKLDTSLRKDVDYCLPLRSEGQVMEREHQHGGHNIEKIMMTLRGFKKFCIKAATEKSEQIKEYFIDIEEIVHEQLEEEAIRVNNEMKLLQDK